MDWNVSCQTPLSMPEAWEGAPKGDNIFNSRGEGRGQAYKAVLPTRVHP